jgi:hypothetical protein
VQEHLGGHLANLFTKHRDRYCFAR